MKTAVRFCLLASLVAVASSDAKAADEKITYVDHVKPIFTVKCIACHKPDKKSSGLDLTNYQAIMTGGSGGPAIEPGDPDASYLWLLVNHESEPYMPPKQEKLPAPMLDTINKWIAGGALETKDSKAKIKPKAKVNFALSFASTGRPEGPPPMPSRLSLQPVVHTERPTAVPSIATSPWAPLAAIGAQKQVLLYNTNTLELLGALPFPEGIPRVLKFSRSGQLLMVGGGKASFEGCVCVYNVKTGERMMKVGEELDCVLGADISSDQTMIALGGPQKMVRVYSTQTGELLYEMKKHTDWVTSIAFSPDGVLLASGDRNGGVFVWEADTGREYLGLRGHSKRITGFAWRKDSNVLASASEDTTVRTWEMENGRQLKSWGAHGGGTASVWFTRDDQIATAGRDRKATLWNQDGGRVRDFEQFADLALHVAFCDETKRVVAGDWTGIVRVWNAADGKRVGELSTNPLPLESRLAAAQTEVTRLQGEQKKQNDAYVAAQAVVTKVKADLTASQKKMTDLDTQAKAYAATLDAAKKTAVDAKAKHDAAAKVVTTLQPLVPLLKETVAKADASVAKAGGDKEVAAITTQLKAVTAAREKTLAANTKIVSDEAARLKAAQTTVTNTEKQIVDNKAATEATRKQIATYTASLDAETKKAAAVKQTLDQATAAVTNAQKAVARWQDEIAFTKKLADLAARQSAADDLEATFAEIEANLKEKQAALAQVQTALATVQQQEKAQTAALTAARQTVTKATTERDANAKSIADREAAVPALKQAMESGAAAAKAVSSDKELAAAATQLKNAFDRNNKAITDSKAKLVEQNKAIAAAQATAKAQETKLNEVKAQVTAATKRVADADAAMKPVAAEAAKAKSAADTARAALDTIQKEIDGIRQQAAAAANPAAAAKG